MKRLFALFFICSILPQFVFAQNEEITKKDRVEVFDSDMNQLERSNEQLIPQAQLLEQVFEQEIDPESYILGPGDQLLIKIWGLLENQFFAIVSPEGHVLIPSVAEVFVARKSLADGSEAIKSALAEAFRDARFSVSLVKMRKFRVFVVGEANFPGTYFLRSVDRVSDAIQLAQGISTWGDDTRIELRNKNGDTQTININNFYLEGDLDNNPALSGGDVIYIPSINLNKEYVIIEGNVGSQGIYQIRENETLPAFLTRLRAINRNSDIENVILFRGDEKMTYNLLEKDTPANTLLLQRGDRVMVPTNRNRVYVRGEVTQPGAFPYLADYTAKDYAGAAGLLETAKDLDELFVIRTKTGKVEKGENVVVDNGDIVVVPRKSREAFKDILTILTPIISIGISAVALMQASKN